MDKAYTLTQFCQRHTSATERTKTKRKQCEINATPLATQSFPVAHIDESAA